MRDFFDQGWVLEYSLSAAAQLLFGDRLVGEAIVVALAWAIGTFLVFTTVRRLTGSLTPEALAALLAHGSQRRSSGGRITASMWRLDWFWR